MHGEHEHHDSHSAVRVAAQATLHCLAGCTIGEVVGMALGSWFGWSNTPTVVVSIVLAFVSGYSLTLRPLRRAGIPWRRAMALALASDTVSIAIMEIVDNAVMLAISAPWTLMWPACSSGAAWHRRRAGLRRGLASQSVAHCTRTRAAAYATHTPSGGHSTHSDPKATYSHTSNEHEYVSAPTTPNQRPGPQHRLRSAGLRVLGAGGSRRGSRY
jgi:hypothetical protein